MKKTYAILIALLGWSATIGQFLIMLESSTTPLSEMLLRFFSYFTILTNILVAVYFTALAFGSKLLESKGTSTAITIYIFIVGFIYQLVLRQTWKPEGFQMVVNELLHSVIPILTLLFWILFDDKKARYSQIFAWAIYPLAYLCFIMIRGSLSGFYPYPFIDINTIGVYNTIRNAILILVLFITLSSLLVFFSKRSRNHHPKQL